LAQEIIEVPITGKIISVNVEIGDEVKEGDTICLLESMKMENPILSPIEGKISQIGVSAEQEVKPGETIAIMTIQGTRWRSLDVVDLIPDRIKKLRKETTCFNGMGVKFLLNVYFSLSFEGELG